MPADIETIIRRLGINDPVDQQIARAGAARIAALDAIGRETAINATLMDKSPAIRAAGVFALELTEAEEAARPPPAPPEMDESTKAIFAQIDAHFAPPKPNPEAKKE